MLEISTYRIMVDGYVVAKQRPRFSNGHVYTPTTTREAEHRIAEAWRYSGCPIVLTGPIHLMIYVSVPRPKMHYRTAKGHEHEVKPGAPYYPTSRPDLDNYAKTVLDALNGVAFRDDSQVVRLEVRKDWGSVQHPEGWQIDLEPLDCCGDHD